MINKLSVTNFRSLEEISIELDPKLTALVGANGAGKSSILRALDVILGPTWPSLRSLRVPQDWTGFDDSRPLRIAVEFSDPLTFKDKLNKPASISGFEVTCAPYKIKTAKAEAGDPNFNFHPLGTDGKVPVVATSAPQKGQPPGFGPLLNVPAELRDQVKALFIDHNRSIFQHQPWARSSILSRILAPARKELSSLEHSDGRTHREVFVERYHQAVDALQTPHIKAVEEVISETAKQALGFMGSRSVAGLDVGFGFADPANPLNSLRLVYRENGLELPAEELGLGVQSAIVVGIFEAARKIGGNIGLVLIEEPEMYLHPQAQRYFYKLLCTLAESGACQVVYSTHSPIFADMGKFEGIRLISRPDHKATDCSRIDKQADVEELGKRRDKQKMGAFNPSRSEVFFANRALLVEGAADVLAIRALAEKEGFDLDGEGIAVIECGSKSAIPFVTKVCQAFDIPITVMHDSDIYSVPPGIPDIAETRIRKQNSEEEVLNAEIVASVKSGTEVFILEPSLEGALGIGRNAADKPMKVLNELTKRDISDWPDAVIAAYRALTS